MILRGLFWDLTKYRRLTYQSSRSKYLNPLLNIFTILVHLFIPVNMMMLFYINIVDIIHIILDWFYGISIILYWLDEIAIKLGICGDVS